MGRRLALLLSLVSMLVPVLLVAADGLAQATSARAAQTITLTVDATEAPRKLFHAREVIPVSPGPLTLYYPKWIPGERRFLPPLPRRAVGATGGQALPLDDVVATLKEVAPYDWRTFLNQRLYTTDAHPPLGGIDRGGWRLVYDTVQGQRIKDLEGTRKQVEMGYSIGLRLNDEGLITDVIPGMPAANAKLGPGMTVVAVDGKKFSPDALRDAVNASKTSKTPIQLLVNNEDTLINYPIDYHGGEQYPHLVRDDAKPDVLSQTIAPLTPRR